MIATVVLAAGTASRFGSPKLLAEWWGRPLVEWALTAAPANGPRIAVVRPETAKLKALFAAHGFAMVRNPRPSDGLASSLRVALATLPAEVDAALVLLGDAPAVPAAVVTRVAQAYRRYDVPVAAEVGDHRSHPVILPRDVWDLVPAKGERAGDAIEIRGIDCDDLVVGAVDVDTPQDLFDLAARRAHAPLVKRLRNVGSLEARLGLPEAFVLQSTDGLRLKTVKLGDEHDHVLVPVKTLARHAHAYGRAIRVIARVGDDYAALVG